MEGWIPLTDDQLVRTQHCFRHEEGTHDLILKEVFKQRIEEHISVGKWHHLVHVRAWFKVADYASYSQSKLKGNAWLDQLKLQEII